MNQSNKRALALFFPSSPIYAKFDTGFAVSNVISAIEKEPKLQNMFDSIKIIYQQTLNAIIEETKASLVKSSKNWRKVAVQKLKSLEQVPELDQDQFDMLSALFKEELDVTTLENSRLPNIVLATPSKRDPLKSVLSVLVCRDGAKSKTLSLKDLARYHIIMPHLKSIKLYMINLDISQVNTKIGDNKVEELDIVLNAFSGSTTDLLMYIFKSYQNGLKTLKLERHNQATNKTSKSNQHHTMNSSELKNSHFKLDKLETLVIKNFYQSLPTMELIQALLAAHCKLKHASFIGLNDESIAPLSKLLDTNRHTLESLSILSSNRPEISLLQGLDMLKSLSLRWSNTEQHADIIHYLMVLPQLNCLELGHDRKHGTLSDNGINLETYTSLHKLALVNLVIEGDELSQMHKRIPHLTEIGFHNCKFGTQRTDTEAHLLLKDFNLKQLIIENGHLFYSKKDKPTMRAICKYLITMETNIEMTGNISSKVKAASRAEENLSILNNSFSYVCMANNAIKQLPILNISVQLLEVLQLDNRGSKAVHFHAVQDKADKVINEAIEDQENEELPSPIVADDKDYAAFSFDDDNVYLPEADELEASEPEEMIDFFADEDQELIHQYNDPNKETHNKKDEDSLELHFSKRRNSDNKYDFKEANSNKRNNSSDEENLTTVRKSARVADKTPGRTRGTTTRKMKRARSISETEDEQNCSEDDEETKKKKSLKRFMYKVRNYRAVIRIRST
jgi:hypothetical protein